MAQHRRRAAVRRGADQDGAGIRPARGRRRSLRAVRAAAAARDPDDPARLADGPPRPPRPGQGGRPDRRGDWPRVLPRAARRGRTLAGEPSCRRALDQLVASELVFRRGAPPEATYTLQARAGPGRCLPKSLLKSKRQQLHARIAQVLEERFPGGRPQAAPEVLAHHFTEARNCRAAQSATGKGLANEQLSAPPTWKPSSTSNEPYSSSAVCRNRESETKWSLRLQVGLGQSLIAIAGGPARRDRAMPLVAPGTCLESSEIERSLLLHSEWPLGRPSDRRRRPGTRSRWQTSISN